MTATKQLLFKSKAETQKWAADFAKTLQRRTVVRLHGEMGAGKTQIVRWILESLYGQEVASPTFAVHHAYPTPQGNVDHIDLYRLQNDADLESTGFWEIFQQDQPLILVEWADRLPDNVWPTNMLNIIVEVKKGADEERVIEVKRLSKAFLNSD